MPRIRECFGYDGLKPVTAKENSGERSFERSFRVNQYTLEQVVERQEVGVPLDRQ